jgi:hypothetical protein
MRAWPHAGGQRRGRTVPVQRAVDLDFAARAAPTNFETTFGNQLSLSANVLLIGGMLGCVFGVVALDKMAGPAAVLSYWWVSIPAAALAIAFISTPCGGERPCLSAAESAC